MHRLDFDNSSWVIDDVIFKDKFDIRYIKLQILWVLSGRIWDFGIMTMKPEDQFILAHVRIGDFSRSKVITDYPTDYLYDMMRKDSTFQKLIPQQILFISYNEVLQFLILDIIHYE